MLQGDGLCGACQAKTKQDFCDFLAPLHPTQIHYLEEETDGVYWLELWRSH